MINLGVLKEHGGGLQFFLASSASSFCFSLGSSPFASGVSPTSFSSLEKLLLSSPSGS